MTVFGIPLESILDGSVLVAFITALGVWFRYGPDRRRAGTEADASERTDYALQVKEFRKEVHDYKNEVQKLQGELMSSAKKISTMELVIELLISDAERRAPNNPVVKQAKLMMWRVGGGDPSKSPAQNTADIALSDAKQTVKSAEATCEEVKNVERDNDRGD